MQVLTFEQVLSDTVAQLKFIAGELHQLASDPPSERVRMLATAFAQQMSEVAATVERLVSKQSQRACRRSLTVESWLEFEPLASTADSQTMTFWLLAQLGQLRDIFQTLLQGRRLGPAKSAVNELAALFQAQGKRVALEAHRFSDL